MGKISTAGVLRLRAIKPSVYDRSAKRFAQDDDFVGVLKEHIPNKLALMGLCPDCMTASAPSSQVDMG
jgi:hypothetical protein